MKITVATLIYKSTAYLDFVLNSLLEHHSNIHEVEYLIVCNDATDEVIAHAKQWEEGQHVKNLTRGTGPKVPEIKVVVHENENPDDWWIQNVYNAWNRCLEECTTEAICFVNSDMAFTDGWLDNLAKQDLRLFVPTSRLVESERMPSLPGLISKNFGQTLATFKKDDFEHFADHVKEDKLTGRVGAYMPSLFNTQTLRYIGGWSKNQAHIPGDRITFRRLYEKLGLYNVMCHDSVVYHFQRGESAETGDL